MYETVVDILYIYSMKYKNRKFACAWGVDQRKILIEKIKWIFFFGNFSNSLGDMEKLNCLEMPGGAKRRHYIIPYHNRARKTSMLLCIVCHSKGIYFIGFGPMTITQI